MHTVLLSGDQFYGEKKWGEKWFAESSLEREVCRPSESKTCPSCVHFQNMLAKSYFELLAQIEGFFETNKDRGSDEKLQLRQNMQEKGCECPYMKQWMIPSSQIVKNKIQTPKTEI